MFVAHNSSICVIVYLIILYISAAAFAHATSISGGKVVLTSSDEDRKAVLIALGDSPCTAQVARGVILEGIREASPKGRCESVDVL